MRVLPRHSGADGVKSPFVRALLRLKLTSERGLLVANYLQLATFGFSEFFGKPLVFWNPSCLYNGAMRDAANFSSPMNLYEASDHAELKILLITGGWDVRRSFNQIGIQPGDRVRILRRAPFGGPLMIDNQGTHVAVGKQLAEQIRVEVLP